MTEVAADSRGGRGVRETLQEALLPCDVAGGGGLLEQSKKAQVVDIAGGECDGVLGGIGDEGNVHHAGLDGVEDEGVVNGKEGVGEDVVPGGIEDEGNVHHCGLGGSEGGGRSAPRGPVRH